MKTFIIFFLLGLNLAAAIGLFITGVLAIKCRFPKIEGQFDLNKYEKSKEPIKKHLIAMGILITVMYFCVTIVALILAIDLHGILKEIISAVI